MIGEVDWFLDAMGYDEPMDSPRPLSCTRPSQQWDDDGRLRWYTRCLACRGAGSFTMSYCGEPHLREPCGCADGWVLWSWRDVRIARRAARRAARAFTRRLRGRRG